MSRAGVGVSMLLIALAACTSRNGGPGLSDAGSADVERQDGASLTIARYCAPPDAGEAAFRGDIADAIGDDGSVVPCASPYDCFAHLPAGPAVFCCINSTCVYGESALEAVPCTDADVQLIQASNYDQSCLTDSDCVPVAEGNFCHPGANNCPSGVISRSACGQYQADIRKTNAAVCAAVISGCLGGGGVPCCRHGACSFDCVAPVDTLAACVGAGGSCVYGTGLNVCGSLGKAGPQDSCAYADETCCVRGAHGGG